MARMSTEQKVVARQLAPEPVTDEEAAAMLLYRPVPQLEDGKIPFKVSYPWIDADEARSILLKAQDDQAFRQRPLRQSDARRWQQLMDTKRFVNFLPAGPLCFDPAGIQLNGLHRMTAQTRSAEPHGFVVFRDVPRFMFHYFDTHRPRNIKDVFHIGARATGAQTASAMKLAMRYEEFIKGLRTEHGWRHWTTGTKDELQDTDSYYARRAELQDWYGVGEKVYRNTKLLIPSVMTFRFFQSLAWPDGDSVITSFCESLLTGDMLPPRSPLGRLREWSRDAYYTKTYVPAKREAHLMLLFMVFGMYARDTRIDALKWAYGVPMTMPYHPDGFEIGLKNVKSALAELDATVS